MKIFPVETRQLIAGYNPKKICEMFLFSSRFISVRSLEKMAKD